MEIEKFIVGVANSNSYVVNDENKKAVIIDCGGDVDKILTYIKSNDLVVKSIILTHYHFDHIMGVDRLQKELGAELLIHKDDHSGLKDPNINLSQMHSSANLSLEADQLLTDEEIIKVGDLEFEVIHTPGHTPGSICIKADGYLFTGDTIFKQAVGRTDFPGGNKNHLIKSIKDKLLAIKENLVILPGHFNKSDLNYEKKNNHFIANIN